VTCSACHAIGVIAPCEKAVSISPTRKESIRVATELILWTRLRDAPASGNFRRALKNGAYALRAHGIRRMANVRALDILRQSR